MTKVIRAKLFNYFLAWLAVSIMLSWFWVFFNLNPQTYKHVIVGMLSITLILYLVRRNKIQKDLNIVATIVIYFFIWLGIAICLVLVVGSHAVPLGLLMTILIYFVIPAARGQNKIFGIELPSIFQDYPSNNFSAKSKIPLVIGLVMGLLVTFVIEYLLAFT